MIDKMRRLELCMRECAATFSWSLSGNCLACNKGTLSFLLLPTLEEEQINYSLTYRLTAFDRIYHAMTTANIYPGAKIADGSQPVDSWGLMSVSTAMRTITSRADRFATALAQRVKDPAENLDFLRYLYARSIRDLKPPLDYSCELIFSCLLTGDFDAAEKAAAAARRNGDNGGELYDHVRSYINRHAPQESAQQDGMTWY